MMPKHPSPACTPQRGVTLIILLVTLVVITLLAVSTVRSTVMDEKMAGNARDRNKAFQAAEAAVKACLDKIEVNDFTGMPAIAPAAATEDPVWEAQAQWDASSYEVTLTTSGDSKDAGLAQNARCLVERLGPDSYRVTGRAVGASDSTKVTLQATYSGD